MHDKAKGKRKKYPIEVTDATLAVTCQNADIYNPIDGRYLPIDNATVILDANNRLKVNMGATVKTAMDSVAVAGTMYCLGEQTAVTIILPDTAQAGQKIDVVFYSGATPATLSITGTTIGSIPVPTANQRIAVTAFWDGTYWAITGNAISTN